MENATEQQSDEAIKVLERAINAAKNSNQAGENAVVLFVAAPKLLAALTQFLASVRALGEFVPGEKITYFEAQPSQHDEALARWTELDRAGKQARAAIADVTGAA